MNPTLHRNLIIALDESKTLSLRTVSYRDRVRDSLEKVLMEFLQRSGLEHTHTQLSYCLHELGSNAHRANLKRAFFSDNQLDINNSDEYEKGMIRFKSEILHSLDTFQKKANEMGLYIKIDFHLDDDFLSVRVRNNSPINDRELARIQKKIEAASQYDNLMDAYAAIQDSAEGAGLGLVTLLQLLMSSGCSPQCFSVDKDPELNETVAALVLELENFLAPAELEEL